MASISFLLLLISVFLFGSSHGDDRPLYNPEITTMMYLKASLSDPQGCMSDWDGSALSPCIWNHVTCTDSTVDGSVTRIDLENCGLSGTIPSQLGNGNLKNLNTLGLFKNKLTGQIPDSLGNLKSLDSLQLSDNNLSGPIPQSLTQVSNLRILQLANNNLSGPIPKGGPFSKFPVESYLGNPGLCGPPLNKPCKR